MSTNYSEAELGSVKKQVARRMPDMAVAALSEYCAMTLFVVVGCGSAMGIAGADGSAWILSVSLTFGLTITALAYTHGAFSGGHINCAVTLGLVLVGHCSPKQGLVNVAAQTAGSITGALILCMMIPEEMDRTGGLGSNGLSKGYSPFNAFVGELMMTFLLMLVVLQTAVNPISSANRPQACLAIGFAVFVAHTVLIPVDGCSINPTRSFGPALVARIVYGKEDAFDDFWIFAFAPLFGAALAALAYEEGAGGVDGSHEEEAENKNFIHEIQRTLSGRKRVSEELPMKVGDAQSYGRRAGGEAEASAAAASPRDVILSCAGGDAVASVAGGGAVKAAKTRSEVSKSCFPPCLWPSVGGPTTQARSRD